MQGHGAIAVAMTDISRDWGSGILPAGLNLHILVMQESASVAGADAILQGKDNMVTFTVHHHFTEEVMTVIGSVHCEAALACLIKHPITAVPVHGMEIHHNVQFFRVPLIVQCPHQAP
jgi:hypothetical protein